ncbi:MAG: ubiquinol-cytochrome c reductase iron-sulfur subunit [Desulfobaccales bacterium]
MERRGFLKVLASLLGLSAVGVFAYPLFRFLLPVEAVGMARNLTIPIGEVPVNTNKDLMFGNTPIIILNLPDMGYLAYSKVCTHLGCLVKFNKERLEFICPCHAGTFDLEGNVVSGPPPKPLRKFAVRVEGDNLVIG